MSMRCLSPQIRFPFAILPAMLLRLSRLVVPLILIAGSLAAVHHTVFWMANWQFSPRLAWLTVLLCGAFVFIPLACWYYFGRSRAPIMAAVAVVILIDAFSALSAGSLDLSYLSYAQGFSVEIAALTLPLGAYLTAHVISRLTRRRS